MFLEKNIQIVFDFIDNLLQSGFAFTETLRTWNLWNTVQSDLLGALHMLLEPLGIQTLAENRIFARHFFFLTMKS